MKFRRLYPLEWLLILCVILLPFGFVFFFVADAFKQRDYPKSNLLPIGVPEPYEEYARHDY